MPDASGDAEAKMTGPAEADFAQVVAIKAASEVEEPPGPAKAVEEAVQ